MVTVKPIMHLIIDVLAEYMLKEPKLHVTEKKNLKSVMPGISWNIIPHMKTVWQNAQTIPVLTLATAGHTTAKKISLAQH